MAEIISAKLLAYEDDAGEIVLTAESEGLAPVSVTLKSTLY
jgi:hypothetical protein